MFVFLFFLSLQLQSKLRSRVEQLQCAREKVGHLAEIEISLSHTHKPITVMLNFTHYLCIHIWNSLTHLTVYEMTLCGVIRTQALFQHFSTSALLSAFALK